MNIILAYDIDTSNGNKKLNNVRKICKNFGKHVQNSLFEFDITLDEFNDLKSKLSEVVSKEDKLVFYSVKKELYRFGYKDESPSYNDILIF